MKKIFLITLIFVNISFGQINISPPSTGIANGELIIYNQKDWYGQEPNDSLKIRIFPIGAFYNGDFKYSPRSIHTLENFDTLITGKEIIIPPQPGGGGTSVAIGNWDVRSSDVGNSVFQFGYGKYKIEFYQREFDSTSTYVWKLVNFVNIDYSDAILHTFSNPDYGNTYDIRIDYFTKDFITFRHYPFNHDSIHYFYDITDVDKNIKMWELHGTFLDPIVPGKGLMVTDDSYNGAYLMYPLNANQYNGNMGHENPGEIGMFFSLENCPLFRLKTAHLI